MYQHVKKLKHSNFHKKIGRNIYTYIFISDRGNKNSKKAINDYSDKRYLIKGNSFSRSDSKLYCIILDYYYSIHIGIQFIFAENKCFLHNLFCAYLL